MRTARIGTAGLITPYVYISAYTLAKDAGFEGTEEEFAEALNRLTRLAGKAQEALEEFERMKEAFRDYTEAIARMREKLDNYPDSPSADDCVYSLLNGQWAPIAAPGELIIVTGGRESKN